MKDSFASHPPLLVSVLSYHTCACVCARYSPLWALAFLWNISARFSNLFSIFGRTSWTGRRGSPSQGLYLHRTIQHRRKTRINIHTLSGIWTHDPIDHAATVIGLTSCPSRNNAQKYTNVHLRIVRSICTVLIFALSPCTDRDLALLTFSLVDCRGKNSMVRRGDYALMKMHRSGSQTYILFHKNNIP
jgi:hypothetical protein